MAQTIPDIPITSAAWVDVNTESSIPVGSLMHIINKGTFDILLYEGTTAPAVDAKDGVVVSNYGKGYSIKTVQLGSLKIWARCLNKDTTSYITVQEV